MGQRLSKLTLSYVREEAELTREISIHTMERFGPPTELDDEVLVGLIRLTQHQNGFEFNEVGFQFHQLLELIGWQVGTKERVLAGDSLLRWGSMSVSARFRRPKSRYVEKLECDAGCLIRILPAGVQKDTSCARRSVRPRALKDLNGARRMLSDVVDARFPLAAGYRLAGTEGE